MNVEFSETAFLIPNCEFLIPQAGDGTRKNKDG